MTKMKTYSKMMNIKTFEERFEYLKLDGEVGKETFGFDRIINQLLYSSSEWKRIRDKAIIRDNGCDLGCEDRPIGKRIIVHHINPITIDDILQCSPKVFDLDNLVCVSHNTHNAIHYSDNNLLMKDPIERKPNDTCPWKNI